MRGPYDHRPISDAQTVPCSLFPVFPLFFPQNRPAPHPPTLWKSFFDHFISCNLHIINNMHFWYVNESVTANPVFCPVFGQKRLFFASDLPLFDDFCKPAKSPTQDLRESEAEGRWPLRRYPKAPGFPRSSIQLD